MKRTGGGLKAMTVKVCASCVVGEREGTGKLGTTNDGEEWIELRLSFVSPDAFEPESDPLTLRAYINTEKDSSLQVGLSNAVLPGFGWIEGPPFDQMKGLMCMRGVQAREKTLFWGDE
jgi:hypothetical protein